MTKEEAIYLLRNTAWLAPSLEPVEEAVDMATEALMERPKGKWIPCSERLPEDSGEYLVCPSDSVLEDYPEFGEVTIMPYDADCEGFGWWKDRFDPVSLGYVDSDFIEYEVIAWMPLPEAYRKEDEK